MIKLRGTRTEEELRKTLLNAMLDIDGDDSESPLKQILESEFKELKSACVLGWTPEQGEDFYFVLVNAKSLCLVEIDKITNEALNITHTSLKDYQHKLSKTEKIRFAIAMDLSMKEIEKHNKSLKEPDALKRAP